MPWLTFAVSDLERAKRLLERRLGRGLGRPGATDWVFPLEDGSPCPPDYLSRLWKRAISVRNSRNSFCNSGKRLKTATDLRQSRLSIAG